MEKIQKKMSFNQRLTLVNGWLFGQTLTKVNLIMLHSKNPNFFSSLIHPWLTMIHVETMSAGQCSKYVYILKSHFHLQTNNTIYKYLIQITIIPYTLTPLHSKSHTSIVYFPKIIT